MGGLRTLGYGGVSLNRELSIQELFGAYNILQYALVFQAGNHLRKWESTNNRVATEEEIKTVCSTVLSKQNIKPTNEIIHMLHLGVTAFYSSNACEKFCNDYENRPNKTFGDEDAKAVKKICEDFMSEFLKRT